MSNLSELLPTGGGQNSIDFVATGTLASGQAVALKTDGTVEAVAGTTGGAGTPAVFEAATTLWVSATFDSNSNKVVIAYKDSGNNNYGTAVVGTVAGTAISFGTASIFSSTSINRTAITFDSNLNKVVIAYEDYIPAAGTYYGTASVGTVAGTSVSFGTPVVFNSASTLYVSAVFDSNSNKVVIAHGTGFNDCYALVGTVAGTSISFGTTTSWGNKGARTQATFDSNSNKVVIAYLDVTGTYFGAAIVGTVAGTSISFGTGVAFNAGDTRLPGITFDSTSNKVVISYQDVGNSNYGTAIVGTVAGTSISFGTASVFEIVGASFTSMGTTFDSTANKVVIAYANATNGYGTAIVGTVAGTAITFGTPAVYEAADTSYTSATFDSTANKVVIGYQDVSNASYGTGVVFALDSTNNASFIGITNSDVVSGASGSVTIKGGISTITGGTYAVTVVNSGAGNKFAINGVEQGKVILYEGATYKFDQSNATNAGHPFRLSTTSDGTHAGGVAYTVGVTIVGTPGSAGAYTQIAVAVGAPKLYYYCSIHSGMGGSADTFAIVPNSTYYVQTDGTLTTTQNAVLAGKGLSSTSINWDYTT